MLQYRSWLPSGARALAMPAWAPVLVLLAGGLHGQISVAAPAAASAPIYSCVDGSGRRLSADRPIPECLGQEQRLLNRDGSQRGTAPPLLSPDEVARRERARRDAEQVQARKDEAVRRDRNLVARYPSPQSHDEARARALAPVLQQIAKAQERLGGLAAEGGALARERARLGDQPVPQSLRDRIGSNEGATNAQESILRIQEEERNRLGQQFDQQRFRLDQLWRGQAPGTALDAPPTGAGAGSSTR